MAATLEKTAPAQATALPQDAVARMQAAPRFFSQDEWDALAAHDGPVVSSNPEGRIPENLETDDNT